MNHDYALKERLSHADKQEIITQATQDAVARAIERHRRLGESIAVWRDGKVVVVPPEEIEPLCEEAGAPQREDTGADSAREPID